MSTNRIGAITEAKVLTALLRLEAIVSIPFLPAQYDFIADRDGELLRVQCKTGRLVHGALVFDTTSRVGASRRTAKKYTEIDCFGVYLPATDQCFLIPISEAPGPKGHFRIHPTRNNQVVGVRLATDWLV